MAWMVVFQEVSGSSGCCCSVKTYSITGYSKKQACMEFIVSCVTLLYLVLPLLSLSLSLSYPRDWHVSIGSDFTWYWSSYWWSCRNQIVWYLWQEDANFCSNKSCFGIPLQNLFWNHYQHFLWVWKGLPSCANYRLKVAGMEIFKLTIHVLCLYYTAYMKFEVFVIVKI